MYCYYKSFNSQRQKMVPKIISLGVCAFFFLTVHSLSLVKSPDSKDKDSSEENQENKVILESLKEFVRMVDKYNLNVTIIGSQKKYGSGGRVKEDMSLMIHMPVNNEHLTAASLDSDKQDKYIQKLKDIARRENVGLKSGTFTKKNEDFDSAHLESFNPNYILNSPGYHSLTSFTNGFIIPENETNQIMYNYIIQDANEPVKKVQVITSQVIIKEIDVSKGFPHIVLEETKTILAKLWMSIDDEVLLARLLAQHLDKKFDGNYQVLVGVENFALGGKKFANLEVADSNVVVFIL